MFNDSVGRGDICIKCYFEERGHMQERILQERILLLCRDCLHPIKPDCIGDQIPFQCEKCWAYACECCWKETVETTREGGVEAWKKEERRIKKAGDHYIVCFRCKK